MCRRPRSCTLDSWRCPHLVSGPGPAPTPHWKDERMNQESACTGSGNTKLKVSSAPVGGEREKVLD